MSDVHALRSSLLIPTRDFWVKLKCPNEAPLTVIKAAPVKIVFGLDNTLRNCKVTENTSDKDFTTKPTDNPTRLVLRRPLLLLQLIKESDVQSVRSHAVTAPLIANEFELIPRPCPKTVKLNEAVLGIFILHFRT